MNKYTLPLTAMLCISLLTSCTNDSTNDKPSSSSADTSAWFTDDRDGNSYKLVKIDTQIWMARNLDYNANGSKCYDDEDTNCAYGRLYDWTTAMSVCPIGWHLPSNADWDKLIRYVDGNIGTSSPYRSNTAGRHLKAVNGWRSGGNGEDTYGFSALPGGYGDSDRGGIFTVGQVGFWWSSNSDGNNLAYLRLMIYNDDIVNFESYDKELLLSVRCVKD